MKQGLPLLAEQRLPFLPFQLWVFLPISFVNVNHGNSQTSSSMNIFEVSSSRKKMSWHLSEPSYPGLLLLHLSMSKPAMCQRWLQVNNVPGDAGGHLKAVLEKLRRKMCREGFHKVFCSCLNHHIPRATSGALAPGTERIREIRTQATGQIEAFYPPQKHSQRN